MCYYVGRRGQEGVHSSPGFPAAAIAAGRSHIGHEFGTARAGAVRKYLVEGVSSAERYRRKVVAFGFATYRKTQLSPNTRLWSLESLVILFAVLGNKEASVSVVSAISFVKHCLIETRPKKGGSSPTKARDEMGAPCPVTAA